MASKYLLLADFLKRAIKSGEYLPGTFLPGERVLSEKFQVSRITVRSALKVLVHQKFVSPIVGSGYRVSGVDSRTRSPRSHLIGGIFPGAFIYSEFMFVPSILANTISEYLGDDYNLVLANSQDNLLRERVMIDRLINANVEGLIIMPSFGGGPWGSSCKDIGNYPFFLELAEKGIPIVLCDRYLVADRSDLPELPGVYSDHRAVGEVLTREFYRQGFRKIIYHGQIFSVLSNMSYHGYCDVMKEYDLEPCALAFDNDKFNRTWKFTPEECETEARYLLENVTCDTAFLTRYHLIPLLERLCPDNTYKGYRVMWGCADFKADSLGVPVKPYPCAVRPIAKIGILGAKKMLAILSGSESSSGIEFVLPSIEY